MGRYLVQASYTQQGISGLVQNPEDRTAALQALVSGLGGTVHSLDYCFGDYDVVLIMEAPDDVAMAVKGGEKVYHCGGGIVYHRHDEKGLNWEPGGIRSGAGVRSSGVSQESTGSSDTWEAALCRLCLRR